MRKIKLLKDHEHHGIVSRAGSTIEVDEGTYNWLMEVYMDERKSLVSRLKHADKIFEGSEE